MSDFAELRKVGITKADLLDHYVYCMEYLWQVRSVLNCAQISTVRLLGELLLVSVDHRARFSGDFCPASLLPAALRSTCVSEDE